MQHAKFIHSFGFFIHLFIVSAFLFILVNCSDTGSFKDEVDYADLSKVSQDALETLKETEFNVFIMTVKHAGAKAVRDKARDDLNKSKLTLDAKRRRVRSAEADLKEVTAAQNSTRIDIAEKVLHNAKKEFEHAKLLIRWKEKEVDVRTAIVKKFKLALSVTDCERDIARVLKLKEQNIPAVANYSLYNFKKLLEEKQRKYQTAVTFEATELAEAKRRRAAYENSSSSQSS